MKVNSFSIKGVRKENEDFILSRQLEEDISLNLIADGMGGYKNGRLAAKTVASTILKTIESNIASPDKNELIINSIDAANNAIRELMVKNGKTLGSTVGGCLLNGNHAVVFWVGDVKITHIRDNKILFESEDHSLINQLKKNNLANISSDLSSLRHVVTRCIKGDQDKFYPDLKEFQIIDGDKIIIFSDGILEVTKLEDLAKIDFDSKISLERMKDKYNNNKDNSSLMVIRV